MKEYTKNHPEQRTVMAKEDNYAVGLFSDSIDEERLHLLENKNAKSGYIVQEIDAGDTEELLFEKDQSFWKVLFEGVDYEGKPYSPIVQLDNAALSNITAEKFGLEYYINDNDSEEVFNYCKQELSAGNTPILFRFAKTDYYASVAGFDKDGDWGVNIKNGYVAQETVFLDFDIISLTFKDAGNVETVIPVASDPIDIINDIEAPSGVGLEQEDEWSLWDLVLLLLGGIIVLFVVNIILKLLTPILGAIGPTIGALFGEIFKGLLWLIVAPFKLIGWAFKGIGELFQKKE